MVEGWLAIDWYIRASVIFYVSEIPPVGFSMCSGRGKYTKQTSTTVYENRYLFLSSLWLNDD